MHEVSESVSQTLHVKPSKTATRLSVLIYLTSILAIPLLGWVAFGPGTPGDTESNGNSIIAFWLMRVLFFSAWVICLFQVPKKWRLMKVLPRLFSLDQYGITDRSGVTTPWLQIKRAYYIGRSWELHLQVHQPSQFKNIVFKGEEIGLSTMDEIKTFIKSHAPTTSTSEL